MLTRNKKERIKERDNYKCVICNSREQLTIDHIIPKSEGGTNDDSNLRTLCKGCNFTKANKPPKYNSFFNLLFSRKTIYEFKNEIKGEMASRDGLMLIKVEQLFKEKQQEIENLQTQFRTEQTKQAQYIGKLILRLKALESHLKIEWVEQEIKEYRKVKKSALR